MIFKIIKFISITIMVLLIFAILPQGFWDWLKPYFNKDVFLNTLKLGWLKLNLFIKEIFNVDLFQVPKFIEKIFGINVIQIWLKIKIFLANIFYEIYKLLSK